MISSLYDKKISKKIDNLATKQAKLNDKKSILVKEVMEQLDSETLINVFDLIEKYGHPREKELSKKIKEKYISGRELELNDLVNLESLYKSNYEQFSKKENNNE